MGRVREQPQGEVLQPDPCRPETGRNRRPRVGTDDGDSGPVPSDREAVMRPLRGFLMRVRGFLFRSSAERELSAELESHLQLHIDDNLRAGMTPREARRVALLRFGPVEAIKDTYRDRSSLPSLDAILRDIRFAV